MSGYNEPIFAGSFTGAFSGTFLADDGAAATPSFSFGSDTDTGFYKKTLNAIGVALGGTKYFHFDQGRFAGAPGITELGSPSNTWKDCHLSALTMYGVILPDVNNTRDIGAGGQSFRNIYTGKAYHGSGSAIGPTISFQANQNSGLFQPATGTVGVTCSGAEQARFTNAGFIVGGTALDASAASQVDSTTQGFLPPRMTTAQMNAIAAPATGLMVYDTTTNQWMGYNGTAWAVIA